MNKETTIAILVGFGVGLTAALLILFLPGKLKQLNLNILFGSNKKEETHIKTEEINGEAEEKNTAGNNIELAIDAPEENALIETDSEKTIISGFAPAESKIVLLSLAGQKTTKADGSGNFKAEIELAKGENKIQIAAYKDKNEPQVKVLTVYYAE